MGFNESAFTRIRHATHHLVSLERRETLLKQNGLAMLFAIVFCLFSNINADFASDHVHKFLNKSVAPCDNFYRHVCSIGMGANETVVMKSEAFYNNIAAKQQSRTQNDSIMSDIREARGVLNCTFNAEKYSTLLNKRCNTDFDCYFDEFLYFFKLYIKRTDNVDDSLKFYAKYGQKTNRSIAQSMKATEKLVELLYEASNYNRSEAFHQSVSFYLNMHDRLLVMDMLNANGTADHVRVGKIHNLTKDLKMIILQKFQETTWMKPANEFGFTIFGQFMSILDQLILFTDFDCLDRNLTTVRMINNDTITRYFEHRKRKTGCSWFDVTHSFNTTTFQLNKLYTSYEEQINYLRIRDGLEYNAYNLEPHTIVVIAPTFYPLLDNSSESTMLAFAALLGHEIYHSFMGDAVLDQSEEYRNEAECLAQHYNQSCQLFAEGECNSGPNTFLEDGPDLEGMRAAFELLLKEFNQQQLNELEYPDLGITREQSFFYAQAMRFCYDIANSEYDYHSPDNIRVNALVSQMPEFSRAFNCQPDDLLYAKPDQMCFLFGAKSTGSKRNKATTTGEKKKSVNITASNTDTSSDECC